MEDPARKYRVLLVEDHPMFRAQLVHLLTHEPDLHICGEVDNVDAAIGILGAMAPDLLVLDITLKSGRSGLDLLKDMKAADSTIPVLVLSMHDELLYAERVLKAGARGYISKHETAAEMMAAVRQVLDGKVYLGKRIASRVLETFSRGGRSVFGVETLTDRELEVFQLIGQGRTTHQIAAALRLGVSTVDTYRARIKMKLDLENASQLTHEAIRWVTSGEEAGAVV